MREWITRVVTGLVMSALGACLILWVLMAFGFLSLGIAPFHDYRLTADEAALLDAAHAELHARMANGEFDLIAENLVVARVSKEQNIREIKKALEQFGAPKGFEFSHAATPEPASTYYPDHSGTNYITYYFTRAEKLEFWESIDWIVDDSGRARIRNYSGSEIKEWQAQARERRRLLDRTLPNELKVPLFGYSIVIRY